MRQKQIKGFNLDELIVMCEENNFSAFRAKQIYHWMYRHGALDVLDMYNLPDDLLKYLTCAISELPNQSPSFLPFDCISLN